MKLQKLFEPGQIGTLRLRNRLVCAPMARNYATMEGFVTPRSLDHYETIAKGGVGLIIVEATCIDAPRGKGFHYGLVLDDDRFTEGFGQLAEVIHRHGAKVAVQLHHGGYASPLRTTHMQPVGPSALTLSGYGPCRELTVGEIQEIEGKFASAAGRAKKAGLDALEIHAAHWYLIAQFLSRAFNQRQDQYGGSLENRARFLLEVLRAIREEVGHNFPIWPRINGQEFGVAEGFTLDEAQVLAGMLEQEGADALHVSGRGEGNFLGYHSGNFYDPPGNLAHLAEGVKKAVSIPVIAVGKINLELAEEMLQQGRADLIAMGRNLLVDPELPKKAMEGRFEDIRPCLGCRFCSDVAHTERRGARCQVNATLGREREGEIKPASYRKRIMIIGSGPAGLEAARVAALRGHEVLLYEKNARLGGQMVFAAAPPHKIPIQEFTNYLIRQINKLGVKIELGTEVTPHLVESLKPDVVILAAGATGLIPNIKNITQKHVRKVEEVLQGMPVGEKIAIIGGGLVGCEVADYLSKKGKRVTVLEILPEIPKGRCITVMTRLLDRLRGKGVRILTNVRCREITDTGLVFLDEEGQNQQVEADTVVLAAGSKSNRELYQTVAGLVPETYLAGDCLGPGRIAEAVADGFQIAHSL